VRYTFRLAGKDSDLDEIRLLNHRVFAAEIAQHPETADQRLVDAYEEQSRFVVALAHGHIVGMVSYHDDPPYSVEKKLDDPRLLVGLERPLREMRLLAVDPAHRGRGGIVAFGLLARLCELALADGVKTVVISAYEQRLDMYHFMGFNALGPAVVSGGARFVPMALRLDAIPKEALAMYARYQKESGK
jgi:GNAT superfamily N-acetyltransferase